MTHSTEYGGLPMHSVSSFHGDLQLGESSGSTAGGFSKEHMHITLTVALTVLYSLLGLLIFLQLCRIVYYRHKKLSHQTFFLVLCLLWASLRALMFTLKMVSRWPLLMYRSLYCVPFILQFATFSLLVLYFGQVIHKNFWTFEQKKFYKKAYLICWLCANSIFLMTNIVCIVIVGNSETIPWGISLTRMAVSEFLFFVLCVILIYYIRIITKQTKNASLWLETRGTSVLQVVALMSLIIMLFASRMAYNFVAFFPNNGMHPWGCYNNADHVDFVLDTEYSYIFLFCALFLWEITPTFVVVWFFRVKKPKTSSARSLYSSIHSGNRHHMNVICERRTSYFFENPRRYDSDDEESSVENSNLSNSHGANTSGSGHTSSGFYVHNSNPYDIPPAFKSYNIYSQNGETPPFYGSLVRSYSSSRFDSYGSNHGYAHANTSNSSVNNAANASHTNPPGDKNSGKSINL
eukprot:Nk52_evm12s1224 gene=Nk52_evmTU12s1224